MTYIDESLAPNETLIYRARFHWLQRAGAYITLTLFLAFAIAPVAMIQGWAGLAAAISIALVGVALFGVAMLPLWTTEIGVTNHRFIFKRGWLRRTTDELQLTSIEEVNLKQSAVGRLLDYGRLILHGTGVNDIRLPPIADPVGLRRAVQEGTAAAKSLSAPQAVGAPPRSPAAA